MNMLDAYTMTITVLIEDKKQSKEFDDMIANQHINGFKFETRYDSDIDCITKVASISYTDFLSLDEKLLWNLTEIVHNDYLVLLEKTESKSV